MIPLKRQSSRRKLPFAAQKREKMMWTGHTTWKINRSIFFFPSFPHSDFYVLFLFASPKKRFSRIGGDFRMFCHWNAECLSVSWKEPKDETWILILERLPFQIAWPNFFFAERKSSCDITTTFHRQGKFLHNWLLLTLTSWDEKCRKSCEFDAHMCSSVI